MYDDNLCQMKVHLSATSTIPTIVITNVLQLQSRTTVSSSVTHLISWRHAHSWCTVSSYSINPYNIKHILPLNLTVWGPQLGPQTKIHYLHLPKWNRPFVFTLHIIFDIIYLKYHMNENQKNATPAPLNKLFNEQDIQCPITILIFVIES